MSLFGNIKKQSREANKPRTRVIKVDEYIKDQNVENWKIRGTDLFETDDQGVPKEVVVSVRNDNKDIQGVADFANPNSLCATDIGGVIRVDRAVERGNGQIVAPHMQRLSRTSDLVRKDEKMESNKIGIHQAWVKVLPIMDRSTGKPAEFATRNKPQHRGNAFVIPKASAENELAITIGKDDLQSKLREAAEQAIDEAPEKTLPMVRLRTDMDQTPLEIVMPLRIADGQGNYQNATREQQIEAFFNHSDTQGLMDAVNQIPEGTAIYSAAGFRTGVFGSTLDFQSGQPQTSLVEEMARTTQRRITRPNEEGKPYVEKAFPEYKLGVISIEIPYLDAQDQPSQRHFANLKSLGPEPSVTASPVAKMGQHTPNPFAEEWQKFRNAPSQGAQQGSQGETAANDGTTTAQQASYRAQEPDNRAAAATAATATAAQAGATEPAQAEPAASEPAADDVAPDVAAQADMVGDLPDDGFDFGEDWGDLPDADELENQLGAGPSM